MMKLLEEVMMMMLYMSTVSVVTISVLLGYLKKFDPELVGFWSSGTGWAGVLGSTLYIAMVALGMSNEQIFFANIPFVLVYAFAFFVMLVKPDMKAGQLLQYVVVVCAALMIVNLATRSMIIQMYFPLPKNLVYNEYGEFRNWSGLMYVLEHSMVIF